MKLNPSNRHELDFHMAKARELGTEKNPIQIYLDIKTGQNIDNVGSYLGKNYQMKIIHKRESGIIARFPIKYLKKVIQEECIRDYEIPSESIEPLSEMEELPRTPSSFSLFT